MDGLMDEKRFLFEQKPVPGAVLRLALPTVLSSLVMVLYNLADTYFVGMLDDPVQNAAVTLAAPVMLAFSAVTNLFGAGSSSVMSRAMGRRAYETARRTSAFGLYCSLACGLLFSFLYLIFQQPLLSLLGADVSTMDATISYMRWTVAFGAAPSIFNVVAAYLVRAEGETLLFCGDSQWQPERVPRERVVALVTAFRRRGRWRSTADSRGYRAYARIWTGGFRLRRPLLGLLGLLRRMKP